jgi:hypothetical protein
MMMSIDNTVAWKLLQEIPDSVILKLPDASFSDTFTGNGVIKNGKILFTTSCVDLSEGAFGGKLIEINPATSTSVVVAPLFGNVDELTQPVLDGNGDVWAASFDLWGLAVSFAVLKWNGTNAWTKIADITPPNPLVTLGVFQVANYGGKSFYSPLFLPADYSYSVTPQLHYCDGTGDHLAIANSAIAGQVFFLIDGQDGYLYGFGDGFYRWKTGDADWTELVAPTGNPAYGGIALFVADGHIGYYDQSQIWLWNGSAFVQQTITARGNYHSVPTVPPIIVTGKSIYITDSPSNIKTLYRWTVGDSDWTQIFAQSIYPQVGSMDALAFFGGELFACTHVGTYSARLWKAIEPPATIDDVENTDPEIDSADEGSDVDTNDDSDADAE